MGSNAEPEEGPQQSAGPWGPWAEVSAEHRTELLKINGKKAEKKHVRSLEDKFEDVFEKVQNR